MSAVDRHDAMSISSLLSDGNANGKHDTHDTHSTHTSHTSHTSHTYGLTNGSRPKIMFPASKDEFLAGLQARLASATAHDAACHASSSLANHAHLTAAHEAKLHAALDDARTSLHARALSHVLVTEESESVEEIRRRKRLDANSKRRKQRQAQRQAQLAAAAVSPSDDPDKENGSADEDEDDTSFDAKKAPRRKSAASVDAPYEEPESKKAKAKAAKRKLKELDDADTASSPRPASARSKAAKTANGSSASRSGQAAGDKDKVTKTRGPSQKEIRAVARLFQNTYEGIWKDMARRDAARVYKIVQTSINLRQSNAKKTASLASKEARRWQLRTNKNVKDLQTRARRGMREMLTFWKRNEREERDMRRRAEKEALDQAKKEEELRESRRQARKLNFLITQTELYSHFIGRKIKTAEASGEAPPENPHPGADIMAGKAQSATTITGEDIDFDAADDDEIRQAAMSNAQNAVLEAQTKARNFNGEIKNVDIDDDDMNFQNPTSLGDVQIAQPKMLSCQLKEYQLKGLTWLANLYEQGINGILADEMGLGKTVQSISVMAYLAETHNIWGPYLVIAPASTLHNWQQEISRFVPNFKVLPYWGNAKDRKILRKFLDRKQVTYTKDAPFHVLITSYQLIVADAQYFQRLKWQYMILDEAQAIKSSSSSRWKSLLSFQCRNRLLLTGTPIQNSMQELWALLHFIMPSLFDSHEEFSEWFSKDIESHAQNNSQLNEQQLKRLHMILKPFMLRRVKKHVQQELGDKIEIDVYCNLTTRQRLLYRVLRSQISLMDLIERATSNTDDGTQSLMNLVMQFRKVCNHPDLFERADVKSAFNFIKFGASASLLRDGPVLEVRYSARNQIEYQVPKMLYRSGGFLGVPNEDSPAGLNTKYLDNVFSIWNPSNSVMASSRLFRSSPGEISSQGRHGLFERSSDLYRITGRYESHDALLEEVYGDEFHPGHSLLLINDRYDPVKRLRARGSAVLNSLLSVADDVSADDYYHVTEKAYDDRVQGPPISLVSIDRSVVSDQERLLFNEEHRKILRPMTLNEEWSLVEHGVKVADFPPSNLYPVAQNNRAGYTTIRMPSMAKFVTDSGKLARLDSLLTELKANDHRVLIYFQMTKMMDLMEEYLTFRQYKYCRLDGSSKLSDRRDLVNDWQTKPELFVFLLSTRAGGLGINLTAADTVIFYDSDWNPTIDSQAMDRAHRLGQTRQVTVYRLLVRGTIEERMRDRAKQKEHVQSVVMEGGSAAAGTAVDFQKPGREVAYWLLDDDGAVDAALRQKEKDREQQQALKASNRGKKKSSGTATPLAAVSKSLSLEDMYHEDEGNFDESSRPATGASTPVPFPAAPKVKSRLK